MHSAGWASKDWPRTQSDEKVRSILEKSTKTPCNSASFVLSVDPISKRRLYNFGEEDQFYIREHPEPIISEEVFEAAQEILRRRAKPRSLNVDGKREKFSRKYAFSCMIECGFCGGTLTRRSWHSSSQYNKAIWQCVVSTKKGKKFCPESKGVDERTIERAFVDHQLCNRLYAYLRFRYLVRTINPWYECIHHCTGIYHIFHGFRPDRRCLQYCFRPCIYLCFSLSSPTAQYAAAAINK